MGHIYLLFCLLAGLLIFANLRMMGCLPVRMMERIIILSLGIIVLEDYTAHMEITWYGHSCFRMMERGMASVVTDPFDNEIVGYEPLKLRADIVTVSHDMPGHNFTSAVKGTSHQITGPGEFEIGDVFITGVQTDFNSKKNVEKPRNTLYVFDYDGLTVAHLGDLRAVPTQAEIEALGTVNVALVPVGGGQALNAAKAAEVISLLEPNIVIPMHYASPACKIELDPLSKFLKEMGLTASEPQLLLKVTRSSLPDETKVIVLQVSGS
jgi:L-ascorbate metabolism protein UlaG (beta-lactamase superfamily)